MANRKTWIALGAGVAGLLAAGVVVPLTASAAERPRSQDCVASWYGAPGEIPRGWPTASGEGFDPLARKAAHRTLPFGTRVKVTNKRNGKSVIVKINDRGPFTDPGKRCIDLTRGSFAKIADLDQGITNVHVRVLRRRH